MDNENKAATDTPAPPPESHKGRLYVRWHVLVIAVLILVIGALVFLWKPWEPGANARTVTVTGDATITADPDEYVFYPSYTFKNANKDTALAALTAKSNDVVSGLKKLGVADNKIKTDSNGYGNGSYYPVAEDNTYTYTLSLTVTTNDKALTQKVQDYLVSTSPTGSVSPNATFSDQKEKQLESQARDKAEKDAHDKAAQSAKNLGFKIGKVKRIEDGSFANFGGCGRNGLCNGSNIQSGAAVDKSLTIQPGQNDLDYSVTVEYYIN